ncbi:MAG: ABC transporter permease subunit [Alphaproteobacteria bacterium]|nr:ABC transporter permease subunit [Alphaproteobacteria bacterium]
MLLYTLKRLLLIIPTLLGVLLLNFSLLKMLPGTSSDYLTAKMYGLTKPGLSIANISIENDLPSAMVSLESSSSSLSFFEGFFNFIQHYGRFDFGQSLSKDEPVLKLIKERVPLTFALGFLSLIFSYALSLVIGARKARKPGDFFDKITTVLFITLDAIPSFLLSIIFIIFFAGGLYWEWFPLGGIPSLVNVPWYEQVLVYCRHLFLPFLILVIHGLAQGVFFVKGAFLEEMSKPYVQGFYVRGGTEKQAFYSQMLPHVFFALLSYFPTSFMGIFFMKALVVEMVFSIDGLGLLLLQAILERDYPVILGNLYLFVFLGLILQLLVDLIFLKLDPRVRFDRLGWGK